MGETIASVNPFKDLDAGDLATLKTTFVQAIATVAIAGQRYEINGRLFMSADLAELNSTLFQVNQAIKMKAGNTRKFARPTL